MSRLEFVKRNPRIFVLCGKAQSGKSYIACAMKERFTSAIVLAYASYLKEYARNIIGWNGDEESKPRDFLQQLGVELIKEKIDDCFLINRIIEDVKVYSYFFDVIIISDARFVEEIDCIRNNFDNVYVIGVCGTDNFLTDSQRSHVTETALSGYDGYDYIIDNDRNVDLGVIIDEILEECL